LEWVGGKVGWWDLLLDAKQQSGVTNADECPYVSRGGLKLAHALAEFGLDVTGMRCADLGCSTGGFTDCLLKHGAAGVVAIDTAYGQLAWTLRKDARVVVKERTNAVHSRPGSDAERVDLVVVDLGWTKQKLLMPAALAWAKEAGRIVTLIKPHYEREERARHGEAVLSRQESEAIVRRVIGEIEAMGAKVRGLVESPILGGAKAGAKTTGTGNREWLALVERG
jgi:23S rRNA (cytidine1920-2'-O)/16S rRNA (cytidine1409-2'-O)-methyltransferase